MRGLALLSFLLSPIALFGQLSGYPSIKKTENVPEISLENNKITLHHATPITYEALDDFSGHFTLEYASVTSAIRASSTPREDGRHILLRVRINNYGLDNDAYYLTLRYRFVWSNGPAEWARMRAFLFPSPEGFRSTHHRYAFGDYIYAPTPRIIEIQPILVPTSGQHPAHGPIEWRGKIFRFNVN